MRRVILYPGSFNPLHIGHLCLANYVVEMHEEVDELWISITPSNPFKHSQELLPEEFRVRWAQQQVHLHPRLKVSTVELSLPQPNYTINTIRYLKEQYPDTQFILLIGMDSLLHLSAWYQADQLLQEVDVWVYPRPGYTSPKELPINVKIIEAPTFDISATQLRKMLMAGKQLPYFLAEEDGSDLYYELLDHLRCLAIK